jgi:putative membrane protein
MTMNQHSNKISSPVMGKKLFWSLFILVLVHTAGAIGMAFYDKVLFSGMTAYNLILMFILLVLNQIEKNSRFLLAFLIAFSVGLIVELIGVNTQKLFGSYVYGDVLGFKFLGVPLLIGVNWFIIVFSWYLTAGLLLGNINSKGKSSNAIFSSYLLQPVLGALFAVSFDWLMEPVATKLGFWFWNDNMIPIFNYTCWFIFSLLISISFKVLKIGFSNWFAPFLVFVQTLFFIFLRIFLN